MLLSALLISVRGKLFRFVRSRTWTTSNVIQRRSRLASRHPTGVTRLSSDVDKCEWERVAMKDRSLVLLGVEAEAQQVLGDGGTDWMARPSKLLDGMAPADLATSPDGARAVIHELRQASVMLRAARQTRKRA